MTDETPAAETPAPDCCAALQAEIDTLRDEQARMREEVLRERADLENQRRRVQRDVEMARKFANERLLAELLPVIDSLEAGLAQVGGSGPVRDGLDLTLKQLLKVGADNGLAAVDPAGQPFNPEHHQAMSTVPASDAAPDGHVVQVFQKGWLLNERLLRPALVVIAQG